MVDSEQQLDSLFRALADPTRRQMIAQLSKGERTVGDLAAPLAMTLAGASKHVGVLEQAGLLTREKQGRERVCRLRPDTLLAARNWVQQYSAFWTERLDALDEALRENDDG